MIFNQKFTKPSKYQSPPRKQTSPIKHQKKKGYPDFHKKIISTICECVYKKQHIAACFIKKSLVFYLLRCEFRIPSYIPNFIFPIVESKPAKCLSNILGRYLCAFDFHFTQFPCEIFLLNWTLDGQHVFDAFSYCNSTVTWQIQKGLIQNRI